MDYAVVAIRYFWHRPNNQPRSIIKSAALRHSLNYSCHNTLHRSTLTQLPHQPLQNRSIPTLPPPQHLLKSLQTQPPHLALRYRAPKPEIFRISTFAYHQHVRQLNQTLNRPAHQLRTSASVRAAGTQAFIVRVHLGRALDKNLVDIACYCVRAVKACVDEHCVALDLQCIQHLTLERQARDFGVLDC